MKHCHFSILYNELPLLKQKLPFLYKHFDQLIFYDLNVEDLTFSTDGSHEFIKKYPDPENKITLIEKRDILKVVARRGKSHENKKRMFAVGSNYVKRDMDVFWCTDMDEFFDKRLISEVEGILSRNKNVNVIKNNHIRFVKNQNYVTANNNTAELNFRLARIARHKPGNIYGHCSLQDDFRGITTAKTPIYHFAYCGKERCKNKTHINGLGWYNRLVKLIDSTDFSKTPLVHLKKNGKNIWFAITKVGINERYKITLPDYIDQEELFKDLG